MTWRVCEKWAVGKRHQPLSFPPYYPILRLLFMEQIEVVGGRYGQDIVSRVPRSVQDLPSVVQRLDADFVLLLAVGGHHSLVSEDLAERRHVPRCLVAPILPQLSVGDPEEVVVCPGYDFSVPPLESRQETPHKQYYYRHMYIEAKNV